MTPAQALLLGIPAGAALMLQALPWWVIATPVLFLLCPKPRWRWRWTIVAGLALGCLRVHLLPPTPVITSGPATIAGEIGDVRETWTKTRYALHDVTLSGETGATTLGAVAVTVRSAYAAAEPGDRAVFSGELAPPFPYLAAQGVVATLDDAYVVTTTPSDGSLRAVLSGLRRHSEGAIERLLPLPESALLSGLLLGSDERLPPDTADRFRAAGLSHLTAVSGSNVALILSLMSQPLAWLPARWRFWPLAIGIGAFTLLVGAPASAVRAALTGVVGLIAIQSGRTGAGRSALILVLAAMTLWEPRQVTADAGFQLSFLATWGIIQLGPPLRTLLSRHLPNFLAEAAAITLAAELPTLPWSAWLFGTLAVVAPFTNLVAAPLSGLATLGGLALVATNLLCPPLVLIVRPLTWLCLHSLVTLAETGARLGAHLPDPGPPPLAALIAFLLTIGAAAVLAERLSTGTARAVGGPATSPPTVPPPA